MATGSTYTCLARGWSHAPDELGDLEEQVLTQAEEMPIEELVKLPESQTLEFKSSMRYDLRQGGATRPLSKLS